MLFDIDTAVVSSFRTYLQQYDAIKFSDDRVFLSLVEDELSHFREAEKNSTSKILNLPIGVLYRGLLSTPVRAIGSSAGRRDGLVLSSNSTSGDSRSVAFRDVEIEYALYIYDNNFRSLSDLVEKWFFLAGNSYSFFNATIADADNSSIPINITIEPPERTTKTKEEIESSGLVYTQKFPMILSTVLLELPADSKIILTANHAFTLLNTGDSFP